MISRRVFLRGAGALMLATHASAFGLPVNESSRLYYMDGYHGGDRGHMPAGCWRDILESMRTLPDWKISLDVEASSWDVLEREDPAAYRELKKYLEDTALTSRIEIVGATFAQPYGWTISGESNIRQIERGRALIQGHFPSVPLDTYAVQEPCWASCMPQILRSFGFKGASLKNASTAWGGYSQGFDAELVNWVGPDGTAITAVPRYSCEDLEKVYETEAVLSSPEYLQKCLAHGIEHPAGMCFQDLGWSAKPRVRADYIRYATWREYIQTIAKPPQKDWRFSMEDILTTLPWGEKTLQKITQQSRSAEVRLLMAEKAATLASVSSGSSWPEERLLEAWDNVLWSQFHDAWITATTRSGREAWAFQAASETLDVEQTAGTIIHESALSLSRGSGVQSFHPLGPQWLRLVNTLGFERDDLVELTLATDRSTQAVKVTDPSGAEIPCQIAAERHYLKETSRDALSRSAEVGSPEQDSTDGGINTVRVTFRGKVPSFGFATYRVTPLYERPKNSSKGTTGISREPDGTFLLESDLYTIRLDPKLGGVITSFYSKQWQREFCTANSPRFFNEYRGYFITQKQWHSNTEKPARIEIVEDGPVRASLRVHGEVGGCPFNSSIALVEGQRRVEFTVAFQFAQDTLIGDPWGTDPKDRAIERRRSPNDGRQKLQALFPANLERCALYKNGAYDVCKSRNADTYFQRWDEIKHDILLNWVDIVEESQDYGLALFSDHTTAYTFGPDHPLGLVLGWGGEGGYWWGNCPLRGEQQSRYAIMPHRGTWDTASLWQENSRYEEPIIPQLVNGEAYEGKSTASLISVSGEGIHIAAANMRNGKLEARFFNSNSASPECTITLGFRPSLAQVLELDGRVIKKLDIRQALDRRYQVILAIPRFGIRTLRFTLPGHDKTIRG